MKKFAFPLDRLRAYRQSRLDREMGLLESLHAEAVALEQRRAALAREERQAVERVRHLTVVPLPELAGLEGFRHWTECELRRLLDEAQALSARIEEQRLAVVEARKEVEMLVTLREQRLNAWRAEVDKETEATVAELVVARWGRKEI